MGRCIGALVLAAGRSSRFGRNKLAEPMTDGRTVLQATLETIQSLSIPVAVVASADSDYAQHLASSYGVDICVFAGESPGLGDSIACGVSLRSHWQGWLICLGDMPWIQAATVEAILSAADQASLVAPTFEGRRGHPVFFAGQYGPELSSLSGDMGARGVVARHAAALKEIPVPDSAILRDVDYPTDLSAG